MYSSTISSHLSGDEDEEKHHIVDQFADDDDKDSTVKADKRSLHEAITERDSETSSKGSDFPVIKEDQKPNPRRRS